MLSFTTIAFTQLQADFTADKAGGCSPLTVSFTSTVRGASSNAVYSWDLGNGNISTLKNPGAVFQEEKSYSVKLTVIDGGSSSVKNMTITVYKKPVVSFDPAAPKVCLPAPAIFLSTSTPGDGYIASYNWDFGNGITQQTGNSQVTHNYNTVQQATVNLTVTNNFGCAATLTKNNILEVLPEMKPVINYDKALLCEITDAVSFNADASAGPGALQYEWQFGDGNTSTVKNVSHIYNKKGLFTATLKITNEHGCQASVNKGQVNVAYFNTDFSNGMLCREVNFAASNYTGLSVTAARWEFGDNTTANTPFGVKKVYAAEGPYTVKLVNTYNNTCKDSVTKVIDVKDNVNYNSAINAPASICIGTLINFSSTSSVTPSSRFWDFGNGITGSYSFTFPLVYSAPGIYNVKLTNTFGTCKEEVNKQVTVHALPDIKPFDVAYSGLCGAPVTLTFKDNTPDAIGWSWRINYRYDNNIYNYTWDPSSLQNPSFDYTSDGIHRVDLTVRNAAGCTAYTAKDVVIKKPMVNINSSTMGYPGGTFNCDEVKMKFGFTASEPLTSFIWDFEGNTSTDINPEYTFTKTGVTTVKLSYTNVNGCTGVVYANSATVYRKPTADFSYTVQACSDRVTVILNSSSSPNTHFAWDFGSGYSQFGSSYVEHTFKDTGTYTVKHIGFNGGCSDTIVKEVYAGILPKMIRITSVTPQQCAGTRGAITFNQTSVRATGLTWNFGDGTVIPYDTSNHKVTHIYTRSGRYNITLTATSDGCPLQSNSFSTILLKQNPILTAGVASICSNQSVNMSITGMETNPYTDDDDFDQERFQYSILKFEYEDGTQFTGSAGSAFNYNNYNGTLTGLKPGDIRIRAIIRNFYTGCYDTSNYVSIKVNGPQAGFKITTNNVCWKSPLVFEDASQKPTNTPVVSWQWNFGDGTSENRQDGNSVSHNYANPGTYTVSLTVADAQGCRSTASSSPNNAVVRGPKAAFTPTGLYVPNVPLNTTITFNNSTNANNSPTVNYVWDYGNNTTGNQYTGLQTYPVAGDYTIKLTATDPVTGCTDNASTFITVRDFNTAFKFTSTYVGASGSCLPVLVRITNLSVNATSFSWDFDGFRIDGPSAPSYTFTTPGKKVITLYSKGYNNLSGIYKDSIYIEESSAIIKADVIKGCTGQQVTLSAKAVNTSSYLWDFGDGTLKQTTTIPSFKHTYLSPGVFTPRVIVKDTKGCGNTSGIAEKIFIDSLSVSLKNIPVDLCQYADNVFIPSVYSLSGNLAGETLTYKWDYGTGNGADNSSDKEGAFTYNQYGLYTIRLTVSSPYGCVAGDNIKVDVHEKTAINLRMPSKLDVCKNSSVPITVSGAYSYEWINHTDDLSNTQVSNPIASPKSDTTYTVVGYDRWKCSSDTAQVKVTVRPLPVINAGADVEVVANTDQQLQATGSSNIIQYTWTPANYLSCINCTSPVVRPKKSTQYILKARTAYNCVAMDTLFVKLQCLNGYIYIPNSFTPNQDGKNELFYIKGKGIGIIQSFRVFNRWGDMVFERKNFEIDDRSAGWDGRKNGQPLPVGSYVYIAEMRCEDGGNPIIKKGTVTIVY